MYIFDLKKSKQEDTSQSLRIGGALCLYRTKIKKAHLPKWPVELTQRLPIFSPYLAGWRMLISSPGGTTCGTGMGCSGQVLPVWEHKDQKSCSKIRYPSTEKCDSCS